MAKSKAKRTPPRTRNRPFERIVAAHGVQDEMIGLKIVGDCLAPRARHGQVAVVEPALPKPGDIAVLWFKGASEPTMKILCRELFGYPMHPESEVVPFVTVEQLNPPKRFSIGLDKIDCIVRVHSIVTDQQGHCGEIPHSDGGTTGR